MITLKHRRFSWPLIFTLAVALCSTGPVPLVTWAQSGGPGPAPLPASAPLSATELDQLVAPIALYPDALVAQVLAASTYPSQVTEAARWISLNPGLSGASLAAAVNVQAWDPSVKALTQFPTVLNQLNSNLSWTSALGEAYYNQPTDVLNAVQVMRNRAVAAGTLTPTPQQNVVVSGGTVVIQPVNPGVVYVPAYNPWLVYGAPIPVFPGYTLGALIATGVIAFGVGVLISAFAFPWGWGYWGCNWRGRTIIYNHTVYISRTNAFYGGRGVAAWHGRPGYGPLGGYRPGAIAGHGVGGVPGRPYGLPGRPAPNVEAQRAANNAYRGYGRTPVTGTNRNAFAGYSSGGEARAAAERGRSSFLGRAASALGGVGRAAGRLGKR